MGLLALCLSAGTLVAFVALPANAVPYGGVSPFTGFYPSLASFAPPAPLMPLDPVMMEDSSVSDPDPYALVRTPMQVPIPVPVPFPFPGILPIAPPKLILPFFPSGMFDEDLRPTPSHYENLNKGPHKRPHKRPNKHHSHNHNQNQDVYPILPLGPLFQMLSKPNPTGAPVSGVFISSTGNIPLSTFLQQHKPKPHPHPVHEHDKDPYPSPDVDSHDSDVSEYSADKDEATDNDKVHESKPSTEKVPESPASDSKPSTDEASDSKPSAENKDSSIKFPGQKPKVSDVSEVSGIDSEKSGDSVPAIIADKASL